MKTSLFRLDTLHADLEHSWNDSTARETDAADQKRHPHLQGIYQADAFLVECSKRWDELEESLESQDTGNPDCVAAEIQAILRASLELRGRTLSAVSWEAPYVRRLILASPRSMPESAACH